MSMSVVHSKSGGGAIAERQPGGDLDRRNYFIDQVSKMYAKRLLYYLSNIVHSRDDAEDLVQETFFRLCTVRDLSEVRNIEAFLFTTAYRLAIDLIRRQKRTPFGYASKMEVDEVADRQPYADDGYSSRQELSLLWTKVQVLPPQRRRTFILRKFNHMSYQDIAEEMNITVGSVRKHLSAALSDCRAYLAGYQ